jgi:hypothetical protein
VDAGAPGRLSGLDRLANKATTDKDARAPSFCRSSDRKPFRGNEEPRTVPTCCIITLLTHRAARQSRLPRCPTLKVRVIFKAGDDPEP